MASPAEQQVFAQRASRDAARAELDGQIARMKDDMEARGIAGRIADEASAKAMAAFDEASLVASESKGVIGGTIALLVIWFFRRPILSTLEAMLGRGKANEGYQDNDHW